MHSINTDGDYDCVIRKKCMFLLRETLAMLIREPVPTLAACAYTEGSKIIVKVMHSAHYLVSNSNYNLGFKSKATS